MLYVVGRTFCAKFMFSPKIEDLWSPTIVKNNLSVTWAYVCMTLILCDHGALEFLELEVFGFWYESNVACPLPF